MDTTTAATQAGVTTATIRIWCRRGVIAATKTAGRWSIDAASLDHRIEIGACTGARRKDRTMTLSIATMKAIGGREWRSDDGTKHRVYLNGWLEFLTPLAYGTYATGNVSWAEWDGEHISNGEAVRISNCLAKVWFDAGDGELHYTFGSGRPRDVSVDEVWQLVRAGVLAAAAAVPEPVVQEAAPTPGGELTATWCKDFDGSGVVEVCDGRNRTVERIALGGTEFDGVAAREALLSRGWRPTGVWASDGMEGMEIPVQRVR